MTKINAQFIIDLVSKTRNGKTRKGLLFNVTYKRTDGTIGSGLFRFGVKKGLTPKTEDSKPRVSKPQSERTFIRVWNMRKKEYRAITIENIITLKASGSTYSQDDLRFLYQAQLVNQFLFGETAETNSEENTAVGVA